ncbi:uncharacterized protein LOC144581598 [Callithrix jacchus]
MVASPPHTARCRPLPRRGHTSEPAVALAPLPLLPTRNRHPGPLVRVRRLEVLYTSRRQWGGDSKRNIASRPTPRPTAALSAQGREAGLSRHPGPASEPGRAPRTPAAESSRGHEEAIRGVCGSCRPFFEGSEPQR